MNRFFTTDDKKVTHVGDFKLPRVWWSRPYEYAFAMEYVKEGETVLDVGCGLEHPFKHYLGEVCKKVVALDTNKLVTDIKDDNVEFVCDDILTYKTDLKFNKIFIISTLEQAKDYMIEKFENMAKMLAEGGKIIITTDYPSLDHKKLIEYAGKAKLKPTSDFNEGIPTNALYHSTYKLNVYNVVLEHEKIDKPKKVEDRKTKVEKEYKTKVTKPKRTKKG
jgi:SAM-dependent methyltransferase